MSWKPAEMSLREAHKAENPNHLLLEHFLLGINFSKASDSNKSRFKVRAPGIIGSISIEIGHKRQKHRWSNS